MNMDYHNQPVELHTLHVSTLQLKLKWKDVCSYHQFVQGWYGFKNCFSFIILWALSKDLNFQISQHYINCFESFPNIFSCYFSLLCWFGFLFLLLLLPYNTLQELFTFCFSESYQVMSYSFRLYSPKLCLFYRANFVVISIGAYEM